MSTLDMYTNNLPGSEDTPEAVPDTIKGRTYTIPVLWSRALRTSVISPYATFEKEGELLIMLSGCPNDAYVRRLFSQLKEENLPIRFELVMTAGAQNKIIIKQSKRFEAYRRWEEGDLETIPL